MGESRFAVGDWVTVLDLQKTGHIRTPDYIRDKRGQIIQHCGFFLNPEDLALGRSDGPVVALYRVSFAMTELWPEYARGPDDSLCIEIYEHWLKTTEQSDVK